MNLLALETATECCSVALSCDGEIITRSEYAPRRHAELLLPMCEAVLAEAGISRRHLDAIAVGRGPGAFTGVRLAVSAAQGIALALDLPVIPISSLAALALDVPLNEGAILAVIDARMGEIYAGCFGRDAHGLVTPTSMESVGSVEALKVPLSAKWNVVGTGWDGYRDAILRRLGEEPLWAEGNRYPLASAIARLALQHLEFGRGMSAEQALPIYLRDKVAFTSEERQQSAGHVQPPS
ncbi:tRNA (adenosine(37)-N6)-threonylcarbamoyltransferase complex dimerization subunit type 1 TsaB [Dokdonella immobilis]|uniref:tRNA threonylcarbamoyladenosine biosynthesis protein TsaB n=1 Tax=Dokdonella immobilis TaxID=578942 RepID=A0A1I4XEN4_9GAMM|nr:tRNA (adenosine(37)-N6)-threonylcarbamoyltransferase complex dimerization subunit type 1 TsaB [Dokdonella immobilis]SFN24122.1 tRNA threonylcarbamoyladenosine biosynthesis protein TsaB [Dokdonella immobilis]